jgi:hypothetical protein
MEAESLSNALKPTLQFLDLSREMSVPGLELHPHEETVQLKVGILLTI